MGGITDLVLQITNPSDKPLTISDVRLVDSDFLDASLEEDAVTIAPNDTADVAISLQTGESPLVDAGSLKLIDASGTPITVVDEDGVEVGAGDAVLSLLPDVL